VASRWWYYRPFTHPEWRPVSHGSCEGNGCTLVIGTPLTGHLVLRRRRRMCFSYDAEIGIGYVSLATSRELGMIDFRTESVAPGVAIDYATETGEMIGIEIFANPGDD
jgi:uncharacterized protein YuzE